MLANTHLAFGLLLALVFKPFIVPVNAWLYYGVVLAAALLPDIDHNGATLNRIFQITKIFPLLFKHRGFFHSIWPAIILAVIIWPWSRMIAYAILIGYGSHLLIDSITKIGVNWLYPLFKFKIQGPVLTGGFFELLLFVGLLIVDIVLILR